MSSTRFGDSRFDKAYDVTPEDSEAGSEDDAVLIKEGSYAQSSGGYNIGATGPAMAAANRRHSFDSKVDDYGHFGRDTKPANVDTDDLDRDGEEDDDESEGHGDAQAVRGSGPSKTRYYNPADFAGLQVSAELRELFSNISLHKPRRLSLTTRLRPFVPDFIPTVGDIDLQIKVPRPDGKDDGLGLIELDEPALKQSDPTVLGLQLRRATRKAGIEPLAVRGIENADKYPNRIAAWMASVEEIHRGNPPAAVTYSRPMPALDGLLTIWPSEFETALRAPATDAAGVVSAAVDPSAAAGGLTLPAADLALDTQAFAHLVCALADIPVHEGRTVESLHMLFSLYRQLASNAHFQHQ